MTMACNGEGEGSDEERRGACVGLMMIMDDVGKALISERGGEKER